MTTNYVSGSNASSFQSSQKSRLPVPHMNGQGSKVDPLSKCLRKLDNAELSKPAGGIFISTNESGLEATRKVMQLTPFITQGCHIGFSGWHNFDILVARKSDRAIICDYNPENAYFLHHVLEIIRKSKHRTDFVDRTIKYVKEVNWDNASLGRSNLTHFIEFVPNISEDPIYAELEGKPEAEIKLELNKNGSWLQTDESFSYIQKLALDDKIVLLTEDIRATAVFQRMINILQNNGIQVDSLYVTNIHDYMFSEEDKKSFIQTVKALSESDTLIIAAHPLYGSDLVQKVVQYKTLPNPTEWFFHSKN